ncbi:hypothetical protein ACWCPQ_16785 [Nocardia sp. NPDC001965]
MPPALPIHPLTGLRALGVTRRGPVWPVLGGDGTGDGNTGDAPPADAATGDAPQADTTDSGAGNTPAAKGDPSAGDTADKGTTPKPDADDGAKLKTDLAEQRTKAADLEKQLTELRDGLGKALGFVKDDAPADPKQLTAQLTASVQEAREARSELAVFRAAGPDIDAQALLDSRTFVRDVHALDPAASNFDAKVAALIAQHVEKNPKFKTAPAAPKPPGRSGGDTGSGKGETGQLTYAQYQALSPAERIKATKEGRANQILGRK